jgi:phospholipase C
MGKKLPALLALGALAGIGGVAASGTARAPRAHAVSLTRAAAPDRTRAPAVGGSRVTAAGGRRAAAADGVSTPARTTGGRRAVAADGDSTPAGGGTPGHGPVVKRRHSTPIRHVVVIYLENHSFDNVLGFWCDSNPGRCPEGGMPSSVRLSDGSVVTPSVAPDTVPNVAHSVGAQMAAIDHGRMDGWQKIPGGSCAAATGYRCISGYTPSQLPNISALASRFAISDNTFSMSNSASWVGHLAIVAASTDHFYGDNPRTAKGIPSNPGWGCDSNKVTQWIGPGGALQIVPSCVPATLPGLKNGGAFEPTPVSHIPTIMDSLDAAGLTWKLYGATTNQYGYIWSICPSFAGCLDTGQRANLVPDKQFMTDAAAGKLPDFSIVTPGGSNILSSCHNFTSMTACDNWLGQLVGAVEKSRDWSSTALFITWDDCGCFYDQAPPPTEPDGTQEGPRVPMLIVSPYARPGFTDTAATSFVGILSYTESVFGLAPLGINDALAYDFANAFNYSQAPVPPVSMVHRPLPASAKRIRVTPALANDAT